MKTYTLFFFFILIMGCGQSKIEGLKIPDNLTEVGYLLDSIHNEDQKYRTQLAQISEDFGQQSPEMKAHWEKIQKTDSSNLVVVEKILEKHGWLGSEEIGSMGNSTLFLVIQHSNQEKQEKYLPIMRQAVKEGKARSQSLALLEDRVSLGRGELQIYGSQVGTDQETGELYVLPLLDPDNVNERRAEMGLSTIQDYISHWNLEWDVEAYKKKLPDWVEQVKQRMR